MSGLECLAISIRGSNSSKAQTVHSILLSNFFRVDFPSCAVPPRSRSEEHTSELQSQSNLVCRLLLEKNIVERAAASGNRAFGYKLWKAALIPKLHGQADDVVTIAMEQCRDGGAVHSTRHRNCDAFVV